MAYGRLKIFFDGGCRPNPGPMEAAVVLRGGVYRYDDLGFGTNSDAEWLALINAVELGQSLGLRNVELIGDAAGVVLEANAVMAGGSPRSAHAARFLIAAATTPVRVRWIKRQQNLAGIALAARHPR